ncbi:hypothetical protein PR048_022442 [Dryococelus australis]|uniref:Uncharacterized protein n=1 Tax=Dryococelus australis TaxID=614101 RepID=A0ABQ9H0Z8_9NEOP|nr:hypothetical protein PR048_022442 [Dryococelus australis]
MPLVGGFSRGSPVSPVHLFRSCSTLTSTTRIGSQDLRQQAANLSIRDAITQIPASLVPAEIPSAMLRTRALWRANIGHCVSSRGVFSLHGFSQGRRTTGMYGLRQSAFSSDFGLRFKLSLPSTEFPAGLRFSSAAISVVEHRPSPAKISPTHPYTPILLWRTNCFIPRQNSFLDVANSLRCKSVVALRELEPDFECIPPRSKLRSPKCQPSHRIASQKSTRATGVGVMAIFRHGAFNFRQHVSHRIQVWRSGRHARVATPHASQHLEDRVCGSAPEWKGGGNGRTHRPTASSGTIPTCENPGVTRPGIEPSLPCWEESRLTAQPPWPQG